MIWFGFGSKVVWLSVFVLHFMSFFGNVIFFLILFTGFLKKPVKAFGGMKQRSDVKASILKIYEMEMRKEEH